MEPSTQASNGYDDPVVATQAKNLTKAIFQHESGTKYDAVGDAGTSHGAGQWQDATWKGQAQEVLGDANAPMTPENQSVVAQGTIRKLIKEGKNAAQIAAIWNSGNDQGWENKIGTTTINGQQIHYDVPKYVKDVTDLYQQYKGQSGYNPTPFSGPEAGNQFNLDLSGNAPEQPKDDSLGGKLHTRLEQGSEALSKAAGGQINPLSGILQTAGAGAGAIGDVTAAGLELIPGVKQVEGLIGKGVGALANTAPGQAVVKGASDFSAKHPELSADIGAVGNIASVLPVGKAVGLIKEAAGSAIGKVIGKDALSSVVEDVSPELTKKTATAAAKKGLIKTPISGKIIPESTKEGTDIAESVVKNIPNFDKLKTYTDKISAVQDANQQLAEKLKSEVVASGKDRLYPFKELESRLSNVEEPISLKGTPFEKQIGPIKKAAINIAKKNGGTISSLFDARKEFDQLVERTYPNLYERENAPMRSAITSIRNEMNNFIEEKLPEGSGFKEKLLEQSRLFRAIDNLAPKAAKEIGSTNVSRFAGKHPIVSGVLKMAGKGAAAGVGLRGVEGLIP